MRFTLALSLAGALVSGYLTWHKLAGTGLWCAGQGGCEVVNASRYADLAGLPVAAWGFGMYLVLAGLSLWGLLARVRAPRIVPPALFGLSMGGVLFSFYLTGVELFVLHAVCFWCVLSAVLITAICILSIRHARHSL